MTANGNGNGNGNPEAAMATTTKQGENLPAVREEYDGSDLRGFGASDMVIPRLKIQQPTSKGDASPGTFVDSLTGEWRESADVVFLFATKGRVLWDRDDKSAKEPLCKSNDGFVPDPGIKEPLNNCCATGDGGRYVEVCKEAKWYQDNNGKGIKPACSMTITLVGVGADAGTPFMLSLHGTSIKPTKRFMSAIMLRRIPVRAARVKLSLRRMEGDKGVYYVPVFSGITWHDPHDYDTEYEVFGSYNVERTFDAEAKASEGNQRNEDEEHTTAGIDGYVPPDEPVGAPDDDNSDLPF